MAKNKYYKKLNNNIQIKRIWLKTYMCKVSGSTSNALSSLELTLAIENYSRHIDHLASHGLDDYLIAIFLGPFGSWFNVNASRRTFQSSKPFSKQVRCIIITPIEEKKILDIVLASYCSNDVE